MMIWTLAAVAAALLATPGLAAVLELSIVDAATGQPVAARVRVRDRTGRDHVPPGAVEVPIGRDRWFAASGSVRLSVPPGEFSMRAERGTEYRPFRESITVVEGKAASRRLELRRWIDMRGRGYSCGENHLHIPVARLGAMLAAEGLDFGTTLSWWNGPRLEVPPKAASVEVLGSGGNSVPASLFDAEVENAWGAVYLVGLARPMAIPWDRARSNLPFVREARKQGALICYQGGWSREVLIDALLGCVDVVNVCNNNFHRHKFLPRTQYSNLLAVEGFPVYANTAEQMLRMNTETYYRLLNCGLRLAAGAGSATGAKTTPAGYNRAYVRAGERPALPQFLEAWRAGRNFVTNGPMLLLSADGGRGPGDVVALPKQGGAIRLTATVISDQPLSALEIVVNGEVVGRKAVSGAPSAELALSLKLTQGTWIAARATAEDRLLSDEELARYRQESADGRGEEPTRLRFAHTSPIYVTVGGRGARVARDVEQARRMIEAFGRFARETATGDSRPEILDALPAALAKLSQQ